MKSARKPAPVQVVYFPKKRARTVSRTQTIPELAIPDSKTEEIEVVEEPVKRRKRTKSGTQPAVSVEPDQVFADMAALGHQLFSEGKISEAKVIFEGLAATASDSFVFTMLGTIALAQNQLEQALTRFEQALKLDPDDLAALVYRAELKLQKKRVRAATDDLERAIALGPSSEPFVQRAKRLLQLAKRTARR